MINTVFQKHRKMILDQMMDNSILVLFSNPKEDVKYDVDRNYYYVSGNFEYENRVVLYKNGKDIKEMMFIHPFDEFKAKWVGAPLSKEAIEKQSLITDIHYLEEFDSIMDSLFLNATKLYVDLKDEKNPYSTEMLYAKATKEKHSHLVIFNAESLFKKARTIKLPEEIEEMKKAISITKKGIENILDHMKESYEYQLESYFDQTIKYHGATGYAFPTIAASGKNGCCLHYMDNEDIAKEGDLILFDLGCSYHMYCSDISRTFPVSGKFSPRQKQIYNIVLAGQEHVLKHIQPGITTKELNQILIQFYAKELKKIGLIKEDSEVSKYYYHGVSHHIGLDCHDLCEYTPLQAGSIISNEPGLYIAEEGIGIRIEDDILVTEDGCINLSKDILKTVDEIEAYLER
ncbi:MAG: aminopeptidase P N-terminal domain-containing protein [Anaeroplasmataceae bacterium]|nr:aminopeptidase P N-terminal domain-containing protein [Anaeroplasmataceae bacterium]MDE6414519.1 aminopeptidase P N-terminal domain-containing protein [Anaeroplasmataceae bacterium]